MTIEGDRVAGFGRLQDGLKQASPWYTWGPYWGPYVSERQWGTVRDDYSEDGDAWNYPPFDHARSGAYRRGEDGLAGLGASHQTGWTGLIADLIRRGYGAVPETADLIQAVLYPGSES